MKLWLMSRAERARYALWLTHSEEVLRLTREHEARVRLMQDQFKLDCVKVNARYNAR